MVNNDWQISTIVTFLKNSAWQNAIITVKKTYETYDLAANIPETGFFGTACTFFAAILDVFPPKPAHFMIGLGLAD